MQIPATPVVESVDIRVMYDVEHAQLLGKGGFSQVVAVLHRPTNTMRALKVMKKEMLRGKVGEMVVHEQEILRRTYHRNIIKLHETITTPHHVYFSLDLMDGDLFELIVRNKILTEDVTRCIMYQLLSAIEFLHSQSIVHRDVKPENILLRIRPNAVSSTSSSSASTVDIPADAAADMLQMIEVRLADFGLAKLVQSWDVKSTPCGTSFYIAPEVIRGIESQGTKPLCTTQQLVKSVDVWSAGVVMFVMLSGRPPFHGQVKTSEERRQLLQLIDRGVLFNPRYGWDNVSEEAKDLILRMLEQDGARRLTAIEALRHPFFTRHGYTQLEERKEREKEVASSQGSDEKGVKVKNELDSDGSSVLKRLKGFFHGSLKNRAKQRVGARTPKDGEEHEEEKEKEVEQEDEAEVEHVRGMQMEIDAIQKDIIETGDKEGDKTSYKQMMQVISTQRPKNPAVMNANAKVGPGALKK